MNRYVLFNAIETDRSNYCDNVDEVRGDKDQAFSCAEYHARTSGKPIAIFEFVSYVRPVRPEDGDTWRATTKYIGITVAPDSTDISHLQSTTPEDALAELKKRMRFAYDYANSRDFSHAFVVANVGFTEAPVQEWLLDFAADDTREREIYERLKRKYEASRHAEAGKMLSGNPFKDRHEG